ncbi:MAG: efflux RND transporter permease subunit, partial [Candidatus Latescibacteria bacterium]|nr:efflux RND transporter permease subunit [Candidatus Latescibacterota bacterium]
MKLTDYSVKNWMTVFVLMFAIVIVGSYSYIKLPREASPDITIPFIVVTTPYTGVSPADMENLVTRKLEDEFTQLSDVKEMRSVSQEGLSSITIEFNPNVDIDDAFQRVKDKVDLAKPELPDDADDPMVNEINFSEFPIMIVGLGASYDPMRLKEVAEDLQDEIENVSGILRVNISGALEREIKVNVDPVRLQAHKLALEDVIEAISREDVTIPGGTIDVGKYKYLVRVPGEIRQVSTIEDLVIEDIDGPVRISDIATVVYSFKERETISRLDGASSITLAV